MSKEFKKKRKKKQGFLFATKGTFMISKISIHLFILGPFKYIITHLILTVSDPFPALRFSGSFFYRDLLKA